MQLFSPLVSFIWIISQSHIHGCVRPLYCQMEKAGRSGRTGDLPHWLMEGVRMVRKSSEESWRGKKYPEEEQKGSSRSSSILEGTHLEQLPTVTPLPISSLLTHSTFTAVALLRFPLPSLQQPPRVLASLSAESESLGLLSSNCIFL